MIGNELRPFQHNATPHAASNSVSSVGLSWEHMKKFDKILRPSSSAASFPAAERTSGFPPRILREVASMLRTSFDRTCATISDGISK